MSLWKTIRQYSTAMPGKPILLSGTGVRPIPLATNEQISVKAFDSLQYHQKQKKSDSLKAKSQ